jgi:DNA-binding IclR family transcriptional regulator
MGRENPKQSHGIKVIAKAFQILDLFSVEEPKLTLNQIYEKLGQNKSTVYRILYELTEAGILAKDPLTKQYQLGLLTLKYSSLVLHQLELRRRGIKYTERLARELEVSSAIGIREGKEIVIIDIRNFDVTQALATNLGFRDPVYCTAVGKMLLATISEEELVSLFNDEFPLKRITSKTITEKSELLRDIREIRKCGYAVDDGESFEGMKCLAVPVFDHTNKAIAALNVSNLSKYDKEEFKELALDKCRIAAADLSKEIGCLSYFANIEALQNFEKK